MKKSFLMMAMAAMVFAGCRKEPAPSVMESDPLDDGRPVPVSLSVSSPSVDVDVKAAGTVGGLAVSNAWNGEKIYISVVEKSSEVDTDGYTDGVVYLMNNEGIIMSGTLGTKEDPIIPFKDKTNEYPYYYNASKVYNFYGYYIDDLKLGTEDKTSNGLAYPITITGHEDVMVAVATPANDVKDITPAIDPKYAYSAYTARQEVYPNLKFRHLLTRFTFKIMPTSKSAQEMTIKGLNFLNMNNKADLTIIGKQGIANWTGRDASTPADGPKFALMEKASGAATLSDLTAVPLAGKTVDESFDLGEAILVEPGLSAIDFELIVEHPKTELAPITGKIQASGLPTPLSTFAAGTSYEVLIKLVGPEQVEVTATLAPWLPGETWTLDTDEPPTDGVVPPDTETTTPEQGDNSQDNL